MPTARPYLSKSRLISAWQCPKKLHLEKHHGDLAVITPEMEAKFAGGHAVGDIARKIYGTDASVEIDFDFRTMLAETRRHIDKRADYPIFEATFRYENVLVRADVLIPDGDGWHLIEVKASTSVKDYHVLDCAIQDWVLRNSGINVLTVSLAHINNQFVYQGDGNYEGLLEEHDLTEKARAMEYSVLDLVVSAREAVAGPMPEVDVGARCGNPYECQFMSYCWPQDAEYPITGLGGDRERLGAWVVAGYRDIRDLKPSQITSEGQQRIHRVTLSGKAELLPGAKDVLDNLPYPRFYLDFETLGNSVAVPFWKGGRPYAAEPFQWSCHIESANGDLAHSEFLDLSGEPPMRPLAEALIDCLGRAGTVFTYSSYEKTTIRRLIALFPDLEESLNGIIDRLWDLLPLVKAHYYHPAMLGSWSIKSVLPCIAPQLKYSDLDGIQQGTAASEGFLEAIDPGTGAERKAELERQLLRYCRFDTEAMVAVVRALSSDLAA